MSIPLVLPSTYSQLALGLSYKIEYSLLLQILGLTEPLAFQYSYLDSLSYIYVYVCAYITLVLILLTCIYITNVCVQMPICLCICACMSLRVFN